MSNIEFLGINVLYHFWDWPLKHPKENMRKNVINQSWFILIKLSNHNINRKCRRAHKNIKKEWILLWVSGWRSCAVAWGFDSQAFSRVRVKWKTRAPIMIIAMRAKSNTKVSTIAVVVVEAAPLASSLLSISSSL